MSEINCNKDSMHDEDQGWVLSALEHDQLVQAKRTPYVQRKLQGAALLIVWTLRLYLVFMMAAVVIQIAHSGGH